MPKGRPPSQEDRKIMTDEELGRKIVDTIDLDPYKLWDARRFRQLGTIARELMTPMRVEADGPSITPKQPKEHDCGSCHYHELNVCRRFPLAQAVNPDDWCGEWRERQND